jgi:tetratricopeptide (TPR) repeat protein
LQFSKAVQSLVIGILLGVASTAARADIDDPSAARKEAKRLRDLGAEAMSQGAFADAVAAFERANELYPSPNLRFNMGVALEGLGRLDEAVEAFEDFLDASSAPADAHDYARTRVRELEPQIARLAVTVSPPNAQIRVDGRRVHLSRRRDVPVMPGERCVTAMLDGYAHESANITVALGAHARLELTLRPIRPADPVAPAPTSDGGAEARRAARSLRDAAIGTAAVGVAGLVLGIVFADLTATTNDQVNHPPPDSTFDPALASRGRTYQALEVTFFSIGAAAAGTAVVLGGLAASKRRHRAAPAATVAASPTGFAVSF